MTVESIADFYSETEIGRELRSRGNEEGIATTLTYLLQARFGDGAGIQDVAERLAHWQDQKAAIRAITQADAVSDIPEIEGTTPA